MQVGRSTVQLPDDLLEYPSVIHALEFAGSHAPDRTALVCGEHAIDYAGYRRAVGGMAAMIMALCETGDRAAVLMTNSIDMAVALMGAMAVRSGDQMRGGEDDGQHREQHQNPIGNIPDPPRNVRLAVLVDAKSADGDGGGNANPSESEVGHISILGAMPCMPTLPKANTQI